MERREQPSNLSAAIYLERNKSSFYIKTETTWCVLANYSKVCINKTSLLRTANVGEWETIIWSNNSSLRWGSRGLICQWGPIRQQCDDFLQQPSPRSNRSVRSGSRGCSSAPSHGFSRHLKIFFNRWKIPLLIRERGFRCWVQKDWTPPGQRWSRRDETGCWRITPE